MTPPPAGLADAIHAAIGSLPSRLCPLSGGCIAEVYRADFEDRPSLVAKFAPEGGLALEGFMLDYLAERTDLTVPLTRHCDDRLLLMDHVANAGGNSPSGERQAAEQLAALHGLTAQAFGFEQDTLIGPLEQPNPWTGDWCAFFRDQRLRHFGSLAQRAGRLPIETYRLLESLCGKLERYLDLPAIPALIHGDIWSGNVLYREGRVAAFIDPAIYFADAEVELAFITLFSTFGESFFHRYDEIRPIATGFHEVRREIYVLYPLLVHTHLFGGGYAAQVECILRRYA